MTISYPKSSRLSAGLVNASILLYTVWLLAPAVQTTGRSYTGALAVGLFALGVLLDTAYLKHEWLKLLARAACAAIMPLLLRMFLLRGGKNAAGFYVQQAMFWFPVVFVGYVRERGDKRLYRYLKMVLLCAITLTTLTTIGWLIQGMLRGGRIYAYSRSLGSGEPGREAYLKELMLRNIGGYDFIYASVVAMPFTMIGIHQAKGAKRAFFAALLSLQAVMVALSQYTYAMVFAVALLVVELVALIIRKASGGRVKMGASLLWGLVPVAAVALLRVPLVTLAAGTCESLGFSNLAFSFQQLLAAFTGGVTDEASRLQYYQTAIAGFGQSPFVGSMLGGEKLLSQHSDILDLLSGTGILGTAAICAAIWVMGRGSLQGIRKCPHRAQLAVAGLVVLLTAALGTVCYSRDISLVFMAGILLVLDGSETEEAAQTSNSAPATSEV